MGQIANQRKGMQVDYDYQMKLWGLQDKQRDLGYRHQMAQFGFQEQGMALQRESAEMQNQFFYQNAAMQQQQTQTQRAWTRQDWGINAGIRNMQWGWQQEDFQEERRFMTGRQRRLAERQQERAGIMHNVEDEQIARQQARQKELWKMEDERFEVSKQQHAQQYEQTLKQFELQKKEFEEQKKFYLENKKIEDEITKLQRQHWLDQHKLSEEQLKLTEEHAKKTLELQQASQILNTYMELTNGEMKTLAEDSMVKFTEAIANLTDVLKPFIEGKMNVQAPSNTTGSNAPSNYWNMATQTPGVNYSIPITTGFGSNHASGGSLAEKLFNVQKVGEEGFEYVVGNEVVPHDESVAMEQAGVTSGSSVGSARAKLEAMRSRYTSTGTDYSSLMPSVVSSPSRASRTSSKPVTIVVNVGNEELARYVTTIVGDEF